MSEVLPVPGDIDQDCCELLLESMMSSHELLATDQSANSEQADNIVRLSAARKFNEADPLEAAAAEVLLHKAT